MLEAVLRISEALLIQPAVPLVGAEKRGAVFHGYLIKGHRLARPLPAYMFGGSLGASPALGPHVGKDRIYATSHEAGPGGPVGYHGGKDAVFYIRTGGQPPSCPATETALAPPMFATGMPLFAQAPTSMWS